MEELSRLVEAWHGLAAYGEAVEAVKRGRALEVTGLSGSLPAFVAAGLIRDVGRSALLIAVGNREARRLQAELMAFLPDRQILWLPPRPHVVGEVTAESLETETLRLAVLRAAADPLPVVVVASAEAAAQRIRPLPATVSVRVGQRREPDEVVAALVRLGYLRRPEVEHAGEFSRRGGIVDVYPPGGPPLRIEWFDDQVESIRRFAVDTQRSQEAVAEAVLGPAREMLWDSESKAQAIRRIGNEAQVAVQMLRDRGEHAKAEQAEQRFGRLLGQLVDDRPFPGLERFAAAFGPLSPLTAAFAQPPVVLLQDWPRVEEALRAQEALERERFAQRLQNGDALPLEGEARIGAEAFLEQLRGLGPVFLSLLPHRRRPGATVLALNGRPAPRFHGQTEALVQEINRLRKARLRVVLLARDEAARDSMQRALAEYGVTPAAAAGEGGAGRSEFMRGLLSAGFVLPDLALAVLGETEFTGREVAARVKPARTAGRETPRLLDLKPGDYVVHATHGIGRFLGVVTLNVAEQHKDYLHIQYAGDDALYVPVEQLGLVQKYIGVEGTPPKLSRMGGADWGRVKERVRASVREIAQELVQLYAQRQARPGFAFGPDTPWQKDFEAAFPYEETPDQLRAVEEIKRDMEAPRPMDRLLCGDVGYGKTEVALRAAFKAIMAGKQVAFLVPTTLLAEQHYATAQARMAGFPVTVEVLSRFRTPAQQRHILERLADGRIDLVIGTQRLLGADVRFHDLGLLVVDEEHRFGVAQKERLKALKANVDVLTLTATPIPRTLHMALAGLRDMSLIETPPEERLPVETVVMEFDPEAVREAIRRELDREGQVFYVQNRIGALDRTVAQLLRWFPELRVGVVHGRQPEERIEEVMARFLQQEYDVLVATSIIESGLDIPNVNTLIVEDSDRLGLAQLYQLRGRVGRSSRLAYAYFTYRPDRVLTPQAEQRLEAIREFTELGAGYRIAMRDLEIRGAGNLLGAEQHGFIASVGLDMYTELLREAVLEARGQAVEEAPDPVLEFRVDAYLPDDYIPDARLKIDCYKRLVAARTVKTVQALAEEFADRFGPLPPPVRDVLTLARIRALARELGIQAVMERNDRVVLRSNGMARVGPEGVRALAEHFPGRIVPGNAKAPELGVRLLPAGRGESALTVADQALTILKEVLEHAPEAQHG